MTNSQNNIHEAILTHKNLIMDMGDNVLLHLKWDSEKITPDGVKGCYVDEMGMTAMKLLLQIADGKIYIKNKRVELRIDI